MSQFLCFTVHFLDPVASFSGNRDGGNSEWPPSPLRLFQALLDAAASRWRDAAFNQHAKPALEWLETLKPPIIVTPDHEISTPFRIAVPNNDLDFWARPLAKGLVPKKQPNELKTMKTVQRVRLLGPNAECNFVRYLISVSHDYAEYLDILKAAARRITHLGWGVDAVATDVAMMPAHECALLPGHRWQPEHSTGTLLRVPRVGTLQALIQKHQAFLGRFSEGGFTPVQPLTVFQRVCYHCATDPASRPYAVFKLLDDNGDTYRHPHSKLIHLAGMVRHLAIEAMKRNSPRGVSDPHAWVERYVAGHRDKADAAVDLPHRQFSYVPLPSTGHPHTDPGVRRVMIVAPIGDDDIIEHLARQLDGLQLKPEQQGDLRGPVFLERARHDNIARFYTKPATHWASFTPVILPGHDDKKSDKTRKLIEKTLVQSGIDQPCEFEWSAFSHFLKSYGAHKYVRDESANDGKRRIGYIRPDHLLNQTAVHLRLIFEHEVPGPITLGAGRHCGLGTFAAVNKGES
jgi:CRISPR-associated protein Csb2